METSHLHQTPVAIQRTGALQDIAPAQPRSLAPIATFTNPSPRTAYRNYSEVEDTFLQRHYCIDMAPEQCAQWLERTAASINQRAVRLSLARRAKGFYAARNDADATTNPPRPQTKPTGPVVQPFRPSIMTGEAVTWRGFEGQPSQRPGAEDHRQHPSLIGGKRVWPDGGVEAA